MDKNTAPPKRETNVSLLSPGEATLHRGLHDAPPRDRGVSAQVQRQEEAEGERGHAGKHTHTLRL